LEFHQIPSGPRRQILQRFEPDVTPEAPELAAAIEKALRGEKDKRDGVARLRTWPSFAIYCNIQSAM